MELSRECAIVSVEEKKLAPLERISSGTNLQWKQVNHGPWIFQDVFRFTDWTMPECAGSFQIIRNGQPARFDEEIFGGDQLEIIFK